MELLPMQLIYKNQDILHTFPELRDAFEILFVLEGIKPVTRQMVHEDDYYRVQAFCDAYGIKCIVSDFKVLKDKQVMVRPDLYTKGYFFVYFSLDEEKAKLAKFYESTRNDKKFGEMLGYPSCCTKFYLDNYEKAARVGDEYSLFTIANTSHPNFLLNNMLRFFGVSLISHFPCSYDCMDSIFLAQDMYSCVKKYNSHLAGYVKDVLSGPVISHVGTGVHALKGYSLEGNNIYYKDAWLTSPNHMNEVLKVCNKIEMLSNNHIKLCQDEHVVEEIKDGVGMVVFK